MFFHSSSNGRISFFLMGLGQPKKFLTNRTNKSLHLGIRFFIARTKKSVPSKDWAFGERSVAILKGIGKIALANYGILTQRWEIS